MSVVMVTRAKFDTIVFFLIWVIFGWVSISSAVAHDVWLEPSEYRPKVDRMVQIFLKIGSRLHGNSLPNIPEWYRKFDYQTPSEILPVSGDLGRDPAGYIWVKQPGLHDVVYISNRKFVKIEPQKFREYLAEEGLEKIHRQRVREGTSEMPAREFYSRCAKTLIQVGAVPLSEKLPSPVDCPLELNVLNNPYGVGTGGVLNVLLQFNGRPLENALIMAFTRKHPDRRLRIRTDKQGRAAIRLDRPGQWLIKAVEMIPLKDPEADWESFWASTTFELVN